MADLIKSLFGAAKSTATSVVSDDFADYATAISPSPAAYPSLTFSGASPTPGAMAYTKWYRVWERTSLSDFKLEMVILPVALLIMLQLVWGRYVNRRKARTWMAAHAPILQKEFASVGFDDKRTPESEDMGPVDPESLYREKTATEYVTYATGRQNIAFLDVKVSLLRRFNPALLLAEYIMSLFFQSAKPPTEHVEVVAYTFDGREKELVPASDEPIKVPASGYDGFVWAIVHKDTMRAIRSDRFDVSLTDVKDNPKLPNWCTVMSESAEVTEALLTKDLVAAIETAGEDLFEHLLVTDQPADRPKTVEDLQPRKRMALNVKLPSGSSVSLYDRTLPLFSHFIRLADDLVAKGHFRAEVTRKMRNTREQESKRVRKAAEEEKAEDRKLEQDKKKKQEREELLRTMSPAEQRKYLEKEREKSNRKSMRKTRA